MPVTYHVAVPFDLVDGLLVPGEAKEALNRNASKRRVLDAARRHAGTLALTRTGDPDTGEFGDAEVIVRCGDADEEALQA